MDIGESVYIEIRERRVRRHNIAAAVALLALLGLGVVVLAIL